MSSAYDSALSQDPKSTALSKGDDPAVKNYMETLDSYMQANQKLKSGITFFYLPHASVPNRKKSGNSSCTISRDFGPRNPFMYQ